VSKANPVKQYTRQKLTREEQAELFKEVSSGEPRASILLAATFVEDALRRCIEWKFGHLDTAEIKALFEEQGGPLHTFAGKIQMGYALDIIDADIQHDLDLLRNLRNGVAHGLRKFTFETDVVKAEIKKLRVIDAIDSMDARKKFIGAFRVLLVILSIPPNLHWPLGVNTLGKLPSNVLN
jgi:DNA-binding MltR family transcriptional regulator